jgi:hypothetical protein
MFFFLFVWLCYRFEFAAIDSDTSNQSQIRPVLVQALARLGNGLGLAGGSKS